MKAKKQLASFVPSPLPPFVSLSSLPMLLLALLTAGNTEL